MKYILALDQGTTSSRAILFDSGGSITNIAQKEFAQHFPQPGWVEHDPMEIWTSQSQVATEALTASNLGAGDIAAIGITNQRETTIVWDRETGQPIYPAIVWQDRRTAETCSALKDSGLERTVQEKTGLLLDPYFSGTKVSWILDHVSGARQKAENGELAFGTVDSWLIWNLTGGKTHVTDATNASRTLLFNIHTGDWDDVLLEMLGVPRALLPIVESSSGEIAKVTNLKSCAGIPIAGIAGDQQAALFGQNCFQPGMAKNTYGTGCFLLMNTGDTPVASHNNLLTTVAWKIGNRTEYALEGSIFIGGAVVQWLRDGLGLIKKAEDIEKLAASVSDTGGVYLVPAFAGLGAPHWDPYARGTIVGLTRGTTDAHLARAALEAIALQSGDVLAAMQRDAEIDLEEVRVDGGASRNNLLMQIQADLLGVPVVRPKVTETTALGAAYLAGLGVGIWSNVDEIKNYWQIDQTFNPQQFEDCMSELRTGWDRALNRAKNWVPKTGE